MNQQNKDIVILEKTIKGWVMPLKHKFESVSICPELKGDFEREAHFASHIITQNQWLFDACQKNYRSLEQAIVNLATIGLTLNKANQYCYLIPRKGQVVLDISYRGLIYLATKGGSIDWVKAEIVYENDEFKPNYIGERPIHNFEPFSKNRGKIIGAYSVTKLSQGDYLTEMMDIDVIYNIRDRSDLYKNNKKIGPWVQHPDEMIKKTVIKRAAKTWPQGITHNQIHEAIRISNEENGEGIDFQNEKEEARKKLIEDKNKLEELRKNKIREKQQIFEEVKEKFVNLCRGQEQKLVGHYTRVFFNLDSTVDIKKMKIEDLKDALKKINQELAIKERKDGERTNLK